jgi:hypothetical protein
MAVAVVAPTMSLLDFPPSWNVDKPFAVIGAEIVSVN